jgi:hypothetical protein
MEAYCRRSIPSDYILNTNMKLAKDYILNTNMKLAKEVLSLCEALHTEIPPGARWITVFGRHVLVNAEGHPINPNVKLPKVPGSKMVWKEVGGELLPHFKRDTGKLAKFLAKKEAEKEAKKAERMKAKMDIWKQKSPAKEEILPKQEFKPIGMSNHEANVMIKVLREIPHDWQHKLDAISAFRRIYKLRYGSDSYPGLKRAKDVIEQYAWWKGPPKEEIKKAWDEIVKKEPEPVFPTGALHNNSEPQKLANQVVQQVQQAKKPIVRAHDKVLILVKKFPGINPDFHSAGFMHRQCKRAGIGFPSHEAIKKAFDLAAQKGLIVYDDGGWHPAGNEPMPVAPHPVKIERQSPVKPLNTKQRAFKDNPTENVSKHGDCGINPAFIVKVKDDGKGLWKPVIGERNYWSHMDKSKCKWANREVMAYEMTRILGDEFENLIPQTTLRDVHQGHLGQEHHYLSGKGSCQNWIDDFTTAHAAGRHFDEFISKNSPEFILQAGGFDALISGYDRHHNNFGFDKNGRLVFIDNGIAFTDHKDPDDNSLSFLAHNRRNIVDSYGPVHKIPKKLEPLKKFNMLDDLKNDPDFQLPFKRAVENMGEIEKLFKEHKLPQREIDAFKSRIRTVLGPNAV